jgi:hypothetical protein
MQSVTARGNGGNAVDPDTDMVIDGLVSANNATSVFAAPQNGTIRVKNLTSTETLVSAGTYVASHRRVEISNLNGAHDSRVYSNLGNALPAAITDHNAASVDGIEIKPTQDTDTNNPLYIKLAEFGVTANVQWAVTQWAKRDNTATDGRLICRGGQCTGMTADITHAISTADAGTPGWVQLTISGMYTGTGTAIIEVGFEAYGGTTRTITLEKPCNITN